MAPQSLIRLYPAQRRERCGSKLAALLDTAPITWRVCADSLCGAARGWWYEFTHPRRLTPGRRLGERT
jgi:hypothetical protein